MFVRIVFLLTLLWVLSAGASGSFAMDPALKDIRVMSYNIRYGTAGKGINHWENRRDFVVDTISAFNPDLLGTQETLKFQRDFLAGQLPGYEVLGVRSDGGRVGGELLADALTRWRAWTGDAARDGGEMVAIYYRRDRFEKLDSGHFWLSETPEIVGSISWGNDMPRMVTWVKLADRLHPRANPIMFFNTHFDHQSPEARRQASRLIRAKVMAAAREHRIVLTGDFNAAAGSIPYRMLFDVADGTDSPVVDSYRIRNPVAGPDEGTFSRFQSTGTTGARIDWIAVSRDWKILDAQIDRGHRDGRTPSDHFPITAVLEAAQ
jgi:endonuclease/exonuclease/phosphatase family metal-dependent hydrolase